jgi:hypothetical protein
MAGRCAKADTGKDRPGSTGRRTTLRVPRSLDTEAARVARELGVSGNEAIVRLAEIGAMSARREREIRRVVERRHAAVLDAGAYDPAAPFPSEEEMAEAIRGDRD